MNKDTLKNLTHAHSWLGLIISGVLMIVFVCGSMSFYRDEIQAWDKFHNSNKSLPENILPLSQIISELKNSDYNIPKDHQVGIEFPNQEWPFYEVFFNSEEEDGSHPYHTLNFDPVTGEQIDISRQQFFLDNLFYSMHIHLFLPAGHEIVGLVSLLFFVVLLSGLCIRLKKLISHFYQYRINKRKDTLLDGHNLIGTAALPYTIKYALTGIYFNLGLIYLGAFGLPAFHGDMKKSDVMFSYSEPLFVTPNHTPIKATRYDGITAALKAQYPNHTPLYMYIMAFDDTAAEVEVVMKRSHSVSGYDSAHFAVNNTELIHFKAADATPIATTTGAFESLHFGNFAGDMARFVMFLLGLACCYLILTGNLIWIEKQNSLIKSSKSTRFFKAMTLAFSTGTLLAVANSFAITRFINGLLPQQDILIPVFHITWILAFCHALYLNKPRAIMILQLKLSALVFAISPLFDAFFVLVNYETYKSLPVQVIWINCILLFMSLCSFWLARHYKYKGNKARAATLKAQTTN